MIYYITKYVVAEGKLLVVDTEQQTPPVKVDAKYLWVGSSWQCYALGRHAFSDRAEAVAAAEKMVDKKIAALKKQIERLKKVSFAHDVAPKVQE